MGIIGNQQEFTGGHRKSIRNKKKSTEKQNNIIRIQKEIIGNQKEIIGNQKEIMGNRWEMNSKSKEVNGPLNPVRLEGILQQHVQARESIREQLKKRTSSPAAQVEDAVLHLFGPSPSASSSSGAAGFDMGGGGGLGPLGGPWSKMF